MSLREETGDRMQCLQTEEATLEPLLLYRATPFKAKGTLQFNWLESF